jgi:hypothetical protein
MSAEWTHGDVEVWISDNGSAIIGCRWGDYFDSTEKTLREDLRALIDSLEEIAKQLEESIESAKRKYAKEGHEIMDFKDNRDGTVTVTYSEVKS